ncbi:hypothetical protein SASPL_151883 [Salvia splendens]|uniref:Uncharacterized protein n=1 Tax=Salvia splendens TaxID=180675 RepID=A0A8X8YZU0_SALSN|nr:hypothetical protein SASPL_151883 [Salvia splendens]
MSSTGASYAHLYVQQKKAQKERTKRMEEERANNGVSNNVDEGKSNRSNTRVYPGNLVSPHFNGDTRA